MFLPYFDVLRDLLLNRCTATWNAFVLYNKETNFYSSFISKSFSVTRKPAFATNTRKAVWRNLLFIKAISLVALRIKGLWLVHKNHATVKLIQMAYRGMKRNESRIELRNLQILKKKKIISIFVIRAALWAEKLGCCLEYYRSWMCGCGEHWKPFDSSWKER